MFVCVRGRGKLLRSSRLYSCRVWTLDRVPSRGPKNQLQTPLPLVNAPYFFPASIDWICVCDVHAASSTRLKLRLRGVGVVGGGGAANMLKGTAQRRPL